MSKNLKIHSNNQKGHLVRVQQSFSGPLPPPDVLRNYDQIVPGSAERIIKMAEGQFSHRTDLERKVINADIERSKRGQVLGFCIAIAGLAVALVSILEGHELTGGLIGGGTLVSLVGVFMYGSKVKEKDLEQKKEESK